jgi:ESF2/ABP1 family protein
MTSDVFISTRDLSLPEDDVQKKRERGPKYTEGWIEFKSKRDAKLIAKQLNNQQVGGRRRTPWYDEIWNIKSVRSLLVSCVAHRLLD